MPEFIELRQEVTQMKLKYLISIVLSIPLRLFAGTLVLIRIWLHELSFDFENFIQPANVTRFA